MKENPFDQLGLKKEFLRPILGTGQLMEYVRSHVHLLQSQLHPDKKGGDKGLSALINSAHTEIRAHPDRIEGWLASMRNGTNPEVRAPPRASARPAATRTADPPREPARPVEPITLHDIVLYDAKGKPARTYKTVTMAGECERDATGVYLRKTQDNWIAYYKAGKDVLPSLPLLYAIIEQLHDAKHPAAAVLLKDLQDFYLCTSTRIDYKKNEVTHNYGFPSAETFSCRIPEESPWLDKVIKQEEWRSAALALLMPKDVDKAVETLHEFSGVHPYVWTASERRSEPLRAAFVGANPDGLYLSCNDSLHYGGLSRRVAVVGG